jgi:glutamate 5-kinase
VDDGAATALTQRNRSLLAAGVTKVSGVFVPGDVVSIVNASGKEIARGLTNYASDDAHKICGKKTAEVRALLGDAAYDEVVHRDNLVIC